MACSPPILHRFPFSLKQAAPNTNSCSICSILNARLDAQKSPRRHIDISQRAEQNRKRTFSLGRSNSQRPAPTELSPAPRPRPRRLLTSELQSVPSTESSRGRTTTAVIPQSARANCSYLQSIRSPRSSERTRKTGPGVRSLQATGRAQRGGATAHLITSQSGPGPGQGQGPTVQKLT